MQVFPNKRFERREFLADEETVMQKQLCLNFESSCMNYTVQLLRACMRMLVQAPG